MPILLTVVLLMIAIVDFLRYRKRKIKEKLQEINLSEKETRELQFLAEKCLNKARGEGIKLPSRNIIVCKLQDDPYTWVIIKLGLRDKELYRYRVSIEEVAEARIWAEKIEEDN